MGIDLHRCAEAAVHAALAEAFTRPETKRPGRRKRRLRPLRALLRAARAGLSVVGLVTVLRIMRSPRRRAQLLDALATRFPIQELLDEIALRVATARAATGQETAGEPESGSADAETGTSGEEPAKRAGDKPPRRPVARRRGDTNGQGGPKPPSRGKRPA